jgi:hypothetical protein
MKSETGVIPKYKAKSRSVNGLLEDPWKGRWKEGKSEEKG